MVRGDPMFATRSRAVIVCLAFVNLTGCSRSVLKDPSLLDPGADNPLDVAKISGVVTKQRETIEFDEWKRTQSRDAATPTHPQQVGAVVVVNDTLHALVSRQHDAIALSDVEYVQTQDSNRKNVAGLVLGMW